MKFQLINYDVWGNKKDGYEVNNTIPTNHFIDLEESDTDRDIIQSLKGILLKNTVKNSKFIVDGEFDYSLYITYSPDCLPVCELRRIN